MFYSQVPCNGCIRCCINDAIRILDHEDHTKWITVPHPYIKNKWMLDHKSDDSCIYLGKSGCTIQHDKPQQCYEMDCRILAMNISYTKARKLAKKGHLKLSVWEKGKELLNL